MGDSDRPQEPRQLGPTPQVAGAERIRAGVRAALFGDRQPTEPRAEPETEPLEDAVPDRLGRFRVLERLGEGGMGVVYSAYDPELDRKVAIKLLRPGPGGSSQSGSSGAGRLQREAQAMARLNHPNVITVHEVGTLEHQLYVAMELVDGGTLSAWLTERERSPDEVLSMFVQAGEGLAAAHAAGLVHRDFKPDNVLIGRDGRVRVLDFGLARAGTSRSPEAERAQSSLIVHREGSNSALETPLTRTGAVMGTPAYMSPEQHLGHATDARSDQFSFCVALWEALLGERPFAGKTYVEVATAVVKGKRRDPPSNRLPRSVISALQRGTSTDPAHRFETMQDLLIQLRPSRIGTWRLAAIGLGVAATASALTWASTESTQAPVDRCAAADRSLHGVWDEPRRARVQAAIFQGDKPYAPRVWQSTARLLDAYAEQWITSSREVCATSLVDETNTELYQRRQRCLDSRRQDLDALVTALAEGGEGVTLQAIPAASNLPQLSACADPKRLQAWSAPRDPEAQRRLAQARARLGAARAQAALEGYDKAMATAQQVIEEAQDLDDPATEAAGLLILGEQQERAGHNAEAEGTLRQAVHRAEVAEAHGTRAQALIALVYLVGGDGDRYAEARSLAAEASAVLRVLGADPLLQAKLDTNLGKAAHEAGQEEEALAFYQASLAANEKLFGDEHPDTGRALTNLGTQLSRLGRHDEAQQHLERALATFESVLGADHPWVATALANLSMNYGRQGKLEPAIATQQRALQIRRASHGVEHPSVRRSMFNLAFSLYEARRYEDARALLVEGHALATSGGDPPEVLARWIVQLGSVELLTGRRAEARQRLESLLATLDADDASGSAREARTTAAIAYLASDPNRAKKHTEAILRHDPEHVRGRTIAALADSLLQLEQLIASGRGRVVRAVGP